ncbi:MAG: ferrochelatase [Rudaea sp.]
MTVSPPAAVLLVNLGTPTAPSTAAVRRYLAEFLSDRRVIETPRWLWWPILHGVILRIRPRRSAHAYAKVWTAGGSPLLVLSRALAGKLAAAVADQAAVALAMRYGEPAIGAAITELQRRGVRRILVLPLYPQYAAATTASVFDAVTAAVRRLRWLPELRFIGDYHADPLYIEALARSVETHWQQRGRAERLMLSFHGLPQRCVTLGDPYLTQCEATANLLRARLGLDQDFLQVCFQSRVGAEQWIAPYTEEVLARWPGEGVRRIQVLCPGFAVDCLETLEEIALRDRDLFLEAGGESLDYIPALNDADAHVELLAALARRHLQGWPTAQARADA